MCFMKSPSIPEPAPLPAAPAAIQQPDSAQQTLRDDARDKAVKVAGMEGTNKTTGLGLTDPANTKKKTLLGE